MRQDSGKSSVFSQAHAAHGGLSFALSFALLACGESEPRAGNPDLWGADAVAGTMATRLDGGAYQAEAAGAGKPAPTSTDRAGAGGSKAGAAEGGAKAGAGASAQGGKGGTFSMPGNLRDAGTEPEHDAAVGGGAAGATAGSAAEAGGSAAGGHAGADAAGEAGESGGHGGVDEAGGDGGSSGSAADSGAGAGGMLGAAGTAGSMGGAQTAGAAAGSTAAGSGGSTPATTEAKFAMRVLTSGLEAPWEVTWGPDAQLWITERVGKRVVRIDPSNGQTTVALAVADAYQAAGQDGVLGLALDPRLGRGSGADFVYLVYTYDADPSDAVQRRAKLVRYTFDTLSETLGSPLTLLSNLPASNDHNSGRLAYGPDDHLYYALGDQGKNQFDNRCQEIRAQQLPSQAEIDRADWSSYEGKVLRVALDGTIPSDNPVLAGVRSHVYSYGHRNPQGLVFGPSGKLYSAEHGPKTDDEINVIAGGKNYGWPYVAGFRDDMAYVYANWSASSPEACASLTYTDYQPPASVPTQRETAWSHPDFREPLMTFYTVDDSFDFMDPACAGSGAEYVCWPTVAPSSIDFYVATDSGIAGWGTSLLVTSLKAGSVFRVQLDADGETTLGAPQKLFKTTNRYRDLALGPDGRTFYVITDSEGATSGPTHGTAPALDNRGAVLEFTYVP